MENLSNKGNSLFNERRSFSGHSQTVESKYLTNLSSKF